MELMDQTVPKIRLLCPKCGAGSSKIRLTVGNTRCCLNCGHEWSAY